MIETAPASTHQIGNCTHFYWVEAINYNPPALRILVSEKEIANSKVTKFDPRELGQPLHRSKDGTWRRLREYNYEIMFDEPFALDDCERIDFFDHHGRLCNKRRSSCPDAGRDWKVAAARIAAFALADDEPEQLAKLLLAADADRVAYCLATIGVWLDKRSYTHVAPSRDERASLFAAAMHHYAYEKNEHAKATISGLGSKTRAQKILSRRVKEIFGEEVLMKFKHVLA